MASAQVVKTSVTNNSPSQDSYHPDDLFQSRYVSKYMKTKELHVFYKKNASSYSGQNFFQRAQFPLKQVEGKGYKVVDASENEVMVVVRHGKGYYNLYISDESGVKYALSREYILGNETLVWGKRITLVDIHRVRSLNGTYLANVIVGQTYLKSVITYNKGGHWYPLTAPLQDHTGASTRCYPPACSLHLHIVLSHWYYYIPGVLSSSSAVGIIIAQGNLGTQLGESDIGVFMSTDGGLTWTKEFSSFHDFVIADHGGILAAVSLWREVKDVWYSCTEGREWKRVPLLNRVKVYGMVTEPGETKLLVNLFGQYVHGNFQWLSVKLNFATVLNRKCRPENYTHWSPNDERAGGQCLLGQHIVYERRKAGDCCFNGEEYEREINVTFCTCNADDFTCDFGFKPLGSDKVCIKTLSANLIPDQCPEGKTYEHSVGYRKVVGDRCVGGALKAFKPQTRFCPITLPGGLSIQINAHYFRALAAHKSISFSLKQNKGSTKTTRYSWDFGDGTPLVNRTGLSHAKKVSHVYVKNGQYVVTVTAVNNAGLASVSTAVTVLDPITSVEIDPPHAVVVGEEAWFNVTFYTSGGPDPEEYKLSYGYVHFMWIFDNVSEPVLTLNHAVSHVFSTTGQFDVTVQAISLVSSKGSHVSITVYGDLTTVRLTFDVSLNPENSNTKEWRKWLAQRLQVFLSYTDSTGLRCRCNLTPVCNVCEAASNTLFCVPSTQLLKIKPSRLEVVVLPGKVTKADVSITPAPTNTSKTRDEKKVAEGVVEIELLHGGVKARVTHVEKLPGRGSEDYLYPNNGSDEAGKRNTLLLIVVSIAAALIVIFLVLTLIYFLRRYSRLQSRYTHLRLYSDGAQLRDRDPLVENETDMEEEPSLYPQPGGSLRYIPVPTSAEPQTDSDDELVGNFQAGSLVVMPIGQDGELPDESSNTQRQV
ncbi:VPS10 domain-containing receptor SorCS1 [Acropora cervicornis]|uniref:VPS10 domain-containing receptor SorCS1 n=1 Tax=Acropora cervicornis TaxID=6130 RepID=A0AAD9R3R8_ACRCE|nr:VPS10 domain-containing receptor SorCS1 [Acropora cervicornis]